LGLRSDRSGDDAPADLDVGDDAPAVQVDKWVKGGPVDVAGGKGAVFPSTRCSP